MSRILILIFIILFYCASYLINVSKRKETKYLILSFFILCTPMQYEFSLTAMNKNDMQGIWGRVINISLPTLLTLYFLFKVKIRYVFYSLSLNKWIIYIYGLIIVSFINPHNVDILATFCFVVFLTSNLLFIILISANLSQYDFINGFYHSFSFLAILQFILAICFPVLRINFVTELFHGEIASEWATRMGTRVGAVGIFVHPGSLALFAIMSISFFLATFFNNYKRDKSLYLILLNIIITVLTYSRTSYLTLVLVICLLIYFYKFRYKTIFSLTNLVTFLVPTLGLLYYVVFLSPFSENFLKSDSSDMYEARTIHFIMSFMIFKSSPIIGVGINTHLNYFDKMYSIQKLLPHMDDFYSTNPIHNIHLITIAETGLLGISLWICFLFGGIADAKKQISLINEKNTIFSFTLIGFVFSYIFYGLTGWAPFQKGILPIFLLVIFSFYTFEHKSKKI